MDCTTRESKVLVEEMAALLSEHVKEWAEDEPERDMGEIEERMRHLLQAVGKRALGKSLSALDEPYPQAVPCACASRLALRIP